MFIATNLHSKGQELWLLLSLCFLNVKGHLYKNNTGNSPLQPSQKPQLNLSKKDQRLLAGSVRGHVTPDLVALSLSSTLGIEIT